MSNALLNSQPITIPNALWRQKFRRRLKSWYQREARDLPWRKTRQPYRVWVSEIMLQQTQVATVERYFPRFIQAFPTISDLAAAEEQEVLLLWEGLGYYRRARGLHQAAKIIVSEYRGKFPDQIADVLALPGIGRYTAGAILSIALDQRHPILEANTIRLHSRLLAYQGEVDNSGGQKLLWSMAEALLPQKKVGQLNQALMELGSTVCKPQNPRCDQCPIADLCPTFLSGLQDEIPNTKKKPAVIAVREAAIVVYKKRAILLRRCAETERWAGLWDFPRFAIHKTQKRELESELIEGVKNQSGIEIEIDEKIASMKHHVTKYKIALSCFRANYKKGYLLSKKTGTLKWVTLDDLKQYPLSITGRKISKLLTS